MPKDRRPRGRAPPRAFARRREAALTDAAETALFESPPFSIEPDWIDYNGHLNMAYYHVMFDRTIDLAFEAIDVGPSYVAREGRSFFTVETHVCYLDEVHRDDRVVVALRVLGHDDKRVHLYEEMTKVGATAPAATSEQLLIHMDLAARRVVPFAPDAKERIARFAAPHAALPWPERAGRRVELRRKR